jgi:hypothetical protein
MKMEQVLRERGGVFNTCGQRWNREEQMDETKSQEIGVATMSSTRNSSQPALTSVETFQFEASQTPNCSVQDEEVQCEEVQCGEVQKNDSFSSSALLGREMFLHAFMAVDYLEFRMTKVKTHFRRKGIFQSSESLGAKTSPRSSRAREDKNFREYVLSERGDVPGWVLVVLMTTGLVTAIWAVAAPKLNAILKNSLDSMNNIR